MRSTSTRRLGAVLGTLSLAALGLVGVGATSAGAADPVSFAFTGGEQVYTVPADASVCSVTLEAAGANGGNPVFPGGAVGSAGGADGVGAASVGGTGGTASATFPVLPGDQLAVVVGGAGGDGADQSQAGGFGGGGNGGNGTNPGPDDILRGGGGGGLSGFFLGADPLLVAGGGGGGGAYSADAGDGGSAGNEGNPGQDVSSHPDFGQRGTGGFVDAGGIGGAPGVPDAGNTAGGDGSFLQGGVGGDGAPATFGAGGGGGGGGGYFGGGAGGGASTDGSGGGGGGGSSFVAATGTGVGTSTLTQDEAGNGAALVIPGDGCRVLTVDKTVSGVVPAGTQFTVAVTCTTGEQAQVTFDEHGTPVSENRLVVAESGSCQVAETSAGGAVSTSYSCTDNHTTTAFCQTDAQRVVFGADPGQTATVTVANVFPAAAAVVTPRFTG